MKHILIALTVLFAGCETIVQVDLPPHKPRLVVDGLFQVGSEWRIGISNSVAVLGREEPAPVENATVEIWQNGERLTGLTHIGYGRYFSSERLPVAQATYTLKVTAPGYDPVTATATTPPPLPFLNFSYRRENTPFFGDRLNITLEFQDPGDRKNYYQVFILTRDSAPDGWYNAWFSSIDPAIVESNSSIEIGEEREFGGEIAVFDDALFNGETYDLKLRFYPWGGYQNILVVLAAIEESVYLHNRAMEIQEDTDDNPFAEPVQHYSNIENGYGIFGAVNYVSRLITLTGQTPVAQ